VFPTHEHTKHRTHYHKEKKKERLLYHLIPTNDNSQHTDLCHELSKAVIKDLEHVTTHRGTHMHVTTQAPPYHRLPTYGKSQHTHWCHELCRAVIEGLQHMNKLSSVHITTLKSKFFQKNKLRGNFGILLVSRL